MPAKKRVVYEAKITSKGQAAVDDIREKLEKWRGAVGGFPGGIQEINAWLREMRGWDELDSSAESMI